MKDKETKNLGETVEQVAARVGMSVGLAYDLILRDAVEADPDELFADTHKRMDLLRKIYRVEPGEYPERVAEK